MGLRIQNNVEAFNTHRTLTATASAASKSMEKLSSGYRINRAADEVAVSWRCVLNASTLF